jgi:hypothetical protein
MESEFATLQQFEKRLTQLERQNRRLRNGAIAILILLVTFVIIAQAPIGELLKQTSSSCATRTEINEQSCQPMHPSTAPN